MPVKFTAENTELLKRIEPQPKLPGTWTNTIHWDPNWTDEERKALSAWLRKNGF